MSLPRIAGITRIRNEEHVIQDVLDHVSKFCTAGVYILDEASEDATVQIATEHPSVQWLHSLSKFEEDPKKRREFEGRGRQRPCDSAVTDGAEWIYCFDADEFLEFDFESFDFDAWDAVSFRLFDFYLTPSDFMIGWKVSGFPWSHTPYTEREWIGPEYRDIPMLFRVQDQFPVFFHRIPALGQNCRMFHAGYGGVVRHYGKAFSIEEWEATCEYYAKFQPEPFKSKWAARKGRAVHYESDFGNPLCRWSERERFGIPMDDAQGRAA